MNVIKGEKRLIVSNFCSQGDWQMANAADANGLVSGHAYTVTAVAKVRNHIYLVLFTSKKLLA